MSLCVQGIDKPQVVPAAPCAHEERCEQMPLDRGAFQTLQSESDLASRQGTRAGLGAHATATGLAEGLADVRKSSLSRRGAFDHGLFSRRFCR